MKRKNIKKQIIVCMAGLMLMAGCGSSEAADYSVNGAYYNSDQAYTTAAVAPEEYAYGYDMDYADEAMEEYSYAGSSSTGTQTPRVTDTNRKLITTANLDVETKEFDKLLADVQNYAQSEGGYLESINTYYGSRYNSYVVERNASLTVRIPADKLDGFLEVVGNGGNITNRSQSVDDITLTYVDMQAHEKTLREEEDRLLEMLKDAYDLEYMIVLEDKLAEVRYQIESIQSQLRVYDNKVNYSTVYMNINEVVDYTPVVYEEPTLADRMKEGFTDTLEDIRDWLEDFAVWFVSNIIYIIIWAAVIFAIVRTILYLASDKRAAKKAAKRAKKQAAQQEAYQKAMNAMTSVESVAGDKTGAEKAEKK